MSNQNRRPTAAIISAAVSLPILGLTGWVIVNHQFAFDQLRAWQYQPTSQIATIAARSGLSSNGRFYFYASQPAVNTAQEFNLDCQRQEAKSAILACYTGSRIYIYDVTNAQLNGIEEVSAAHETLHAIWDRMSEADKQSTGALLEAEYVKLNNSSLKERMAYYDRNEPGQHANELHSIIGTEVAGLSPKLEAHYGKYFNDRTKVVALHDGYQQLFDGIQSQSDALLAELNRLAGDISASIAHYNDSASTLTTDTNNLKARANSVDRTSASQVNAYNSSRQSLIDRIDQLEVLRTAIAAKTASYNTKLVDYNKLIVRSDQLKQSLDSTLAPAPSL